jgi:phosphocarrier protein FPr/phosphocarrier protein
LQDGCGEKSGEQAPLSLVRTPPAEAPARAPASPGELAGAPASPGLAIGRVLQHRRGALVVPETGGTEAAERAKYAAALHEAAAQLEKLRAHAAPLQAQLLGVHLSLLDDPELAEFAEGPLRAGKSAAFAWQHAFTTQAQTLGALENKLLRERATDVRDVGRRALLLLVPGAQEGSLKVPENTVLIAEEITPSEMASLERGKLAGLCTTTGSSTSHVAILARAMGIPAVCGIDEAALGLADGEQVILDGTRGVLRARPTVAQLEQAQAQLSRESKQRAAEQGKASLLAHTRDGHRVEVVANITSAADAKKAVAAGAEGVGLLRTEFLFEDRDTAPTEDEQAAQYCAIAEVLGKERPFVIRTLDAGADKPLSYLQLPKEQNPFLGLRGVRISLAYPEMFRAQLRAVLRSAAMGNVLVMFPMIADVGEVRAVKALLAEEQKKLPAPAPLKVGVMIEVPSAVLQAELLAREVDFFSIGTNDLTQYVLAMDRGHPKLAKQAEAIHPAVLKMIGMTCDGARAHGKWVGVCGGLASDPQAAPLLVGLGVAELSVSVPAIASVKAALARFTLAECKALAQSALQLATISEVRALLVAQAEAHASAEG